MSKIIIFNGPPDCGKDEAVRYLVRQHGAYPFSFKSQLKKLTLAFYCIPEEQWDSWYTREGKEIPRPELNGLSCRQAFIRVSEDITKPHFGKDYFGWAEARKLAQVSPFVCAASDGGFNEEVIPLIDQFQQDNVFIVKIYRSGRSFSGDSRSWIDTDQIPESNYYVIENDSTLEYFWKDLENMYQYVISK